MRPSLPMPRNAQAIVSARSGGLRPARPVAVSFVGDVPWDTPTVYADSGRHYDWSWARDLQAYIVMRPGIDIGPALRGLFDPYAFHYLGLVDIDKRAVAFVIDIAPPKLWHRADVSDFFPS